MTTPILRRAFSEWYEKYSTLPISTLRHIARLNFGIKDVEDKSYEEILSALLKTFPSPDYLSTYEQKLTPAGVTVLQEYAYGGYGELNQILYALNQNEDLIKAVVIPQDEEGPLSRMGQNAPGVGWQRSYQRLGRALFEIVRLLDLFEDLPPTQNSLVLWSGRLRRTKEWKEREIGDIFMASGFFSMSTSLAPITEGYLNFEETPPCCLLHVRIPAGAHVLFLPNELEAVLPPGTQFRIIDKRIRTFASEHIVDARGTRTGPGGKDFQAQYFQLEMIGQSESEYDFLRGQLAKYTAALIPSYPPLQQLFANKDWALGDKSAFILALNAAKDFARVGGDSAWLNGSLTYESSKFIPLASEAEQKTSAAAEIDEFLKPSEPLERPTYTRGVLLPYAATGWYSRRWLELLGLAGKSTLFLETSVPDWVAQELVAWLDAEAGYFPRDAKRRALNGLARLFLP